MDRGQMPEPWIHYVNLAENRETLRPHLTDEGLLPISCIEVHALVRGSELYLKGKRPIRVFPQSLADSVAPEIIRHRDRWPSAAIRVDVAPGIRGRVRIFGVAFEDAIAKAHSEGYLKSKFQLVDPGVVKNDGPPATLILLTRFDRARSTLIVQAYQCVDTTPETFLIHAELTDGSHHFHHLDGSQLYLSPEQRSNLSISCTKEKGKKVKYFRIDDDVSRADAYDLIRRFFPIESLTLECFSVSGERE